MEWPALLLVGLVIAVVFVIVALRGSFRSDDEFYGGTPIPPAGPSSDDRHGGSDDTGDSGAGGTGGDAGGDRGDGGAGGS